MSSQFSPNLEILENIFEGVYFVDTSRKITYWNKGAEAVTGYKSQELVGMHCFNNILNHVDQNGKHLCIDGCPLHQTILDGKQRSADVFLQHKLGHRVAVSIRTMPLFDNEKIMGAVEVFVDGSKKADIDRTIEELMSFAMYDQLTELPNRRYLDSFLNNRLREFKVLGRPFAVVMMDIDHFKNFNDSYGHDAGDEVLIMVAKDFKSAFRKSDLVGRWGGEEFLAILPGITSERLQTIANGARILVQQSKLKYKREDLHVTISAGATLIAEKDTLKSVINRADKALYMSKESGRNRTTIL